MPATMPRIAPQADNRLGDPARWRKHRRETPGYWNRAPGGGQHPVALNRQPQQQAYDYAGGDDYRGNRACGSESAKQCTPPTDRL